MSGAAWLLRFAVAVGLASCTNAPPAYAPETARIGNLLVSGVPAIPDVLRSRLQQYRNTRTARLLDWLDEGVLVTTRFGNSPQLHRVRVPGGAREQLSFFAEPVRLAYVPPKGQERGFVYLRDVGGSEFYQLFWFDIAGGESRLLSDGKSRYTEVRWANAGDRFAYTTTERDGVHWDIHVQAVAGGAEAVLETEDGAWFSLDWHPDDSRLLVMRYVSPAESHLFELDLHSGRLTPLLGQLGEDVMVAVSDARYGPEGSGVFFVADVGAEFMRLRLGVGHPGEKTRVTAYVLKRGAADVERAVENNIDDAIAVLPLLMDDGLNAAMKALHTKEE